MSKQEIIDKVLKDLLNKENIQIFPHSDIAVMKAISLAIDLTEQRCLEIKQKVEEELFNQENIEHNCPQFRGNFKLSDLLKAQLKVLNEIVKEEARL